MHIFDLTAKTLRQMPTRPMRMPLIYGVLLTLGSTLLLGAGTFLLTGGFFSSLTLPWFGHELGAAGTALGAVAGLGAIAGMIFLFFPAAAMAVALLVDSVSKAVEARHYPNAPPASDLGIGPALLISVKYILITIVVNLLLIWLYFLFPPALALVNGYILGHEYFTLAARRRHPKAQAAALRRRVRGQMWIGGAMLATLTAIPGLNLLAPIFGAALMTHLANVARIKAWSA